MLVVAFITDFPVFCSVQSGNSFLLSVKQLKGETIHHFILIDGTWSNSAAMFRRLQVFLDGFLPFLKLNIFMI